MRKTVVFLICILILGSFLRFYKIGEESFWLDEGATATVMLKHGSLGILKNIYLYGNTLPEYYSVGGEVPLYFILLHYWTRIFSISEISLRSFSAIFDILSILLVFLVAKKLLNEKVALLSSFFYAISIPAIEHSQEARQYSIYVFFVLLSTYFFIRILKNNKFTSWVLYMASITLGLYTSYLIFFVLVIDVIFLAYTIFVVRLDKNFVKKAIIAYVILFLINLPLIFSSLQPKNTVEIWLTRPADASSITPASIIKVMVNLSGWIYPTESLKLKIKNNDFKTFSLLDLLLIISLMLVVIFSYGFFIISFFKRGNKSNTLLLLLWFFVPIVISLVFSLFTYIRVFSSVRYLLISVPPFIILFSQGIISLKRYKKLMIILLLAAHIMPLHSYYTNLDKPQFREASAYLSGFNEPIFVNIATAQVALKYYSEKKENVIGIRNFDDLKAKLNGNNSFWLVLTFTKYTGQEDKIKDFLKKGYIITEQKHFFDVELLHYKKI